MRAVYYEKTFVIFAIGEMGANLLTARASMEKENHGAALETQVTQRQAV